MEAEAMLWNIYDEISDVINFSNIDDRHRERLEHIRNIVSEIIEDV